MGGPRAKSVSLFDGAIIRRAAFDSLMKFAPQHLYANPVMFVVEIGSVLTTVLVMRDISAPSTNAAPLWFTGSVTLWLWFTVLFANFAEAIAEGRGKAQADTLRKMRTETIAFRMEDGRITEVPASALRKGNKVVVEAGQHIPATAGIERMTPPAIRKPKAWIG